jgi:ATP-binding cassette subfamily B protein
VLKLRRFLKPFIAGLVVAIVLLFVQAICELNLPNYMSKIVNVGIQQGGVEDATPRALSQSGYSFITSFMDDGEQATVQRSYLLVSGSELDSDGKPYSDTYTKAADEQIYVLRDGLGDDSIKELDDIFGTATWSMVNLLRQLQSAQADGTLEATISEQLEQRALEQIKQQLEDSGQPLPPGMTVDEMAAQLLEQQKQGASGQGVAGQGVAGQGAAEPGAAGQAAAGQDVAGQGGTPNQQDALSQLQDELGLSDIDIDRLQEATGTAPDDGSGTAASTSTNIQSLDFAQLYQFQALLELLPESWFADAHQQAVEMDASLRAQSGTMLVAGFYRELGCDMAAFEINYIIYIGLIMLLITAISGVATVLVGYISSRIGAGVARDLRKSIFNKVLNFSNAEFDRFSTASLITRSTNDVAVIQMLLSLGIRMICYAPIMGIGGVIMALEKSVSMSWIIAVAVVVLLGIMLVLFATVMPKFQLMQTLIDRLNLVARESLNGLMVVRAFACADFEQQRFDVANKELTRVNLFVNRAMTFMMPALMLFMNGLTVLIIWVGSHQVAESQMQVGDMMAYMQYVMQIIMSFMFIAMLFVFIPRATVSAKRINEVLTAEPTIVDPDQPLHIEDDRRGLVEFKNVSFRFGGAKENALCNISFTAYPGQTTAFIGSTGSGKSTIINLIPRFYDVTEGEVRVGGVDVRQLSQEELRSCIGYVPQQSHLMAGTIGSNIAFGVGDLPEAEMEQVAEVAQALDFINEQDEGFDMAVSQGGSSVSGGQRQRLAIARALAVRPDIYLFDDSFSALDFKTDAALRKALANYTDKATLIIVAQRVSTIMNADQIFVIDEGRIVGSGSHAELLASCDAYLEIASSQLSESELSGATKLPGASKKPPAAGASKELSEAGASQAPGDPGSKGGK